MKEYLFPNILHLIRTLDRSEKRCFVPKVPYLDIKCTRLTTEKKAKEEKWVQVQRARNSLLNDIEHPVTQLAPPPRLAPLASWRVASHPSRSRIPRAHTLNLTYITFLRSLILRPRAPSKYAACDSARTPKRVSTNFIKREKMKT